jgi:hypothetical protein
MSAIVESNIVTGYYLHRQYVENKMSGAERFYPLEEVQKLEAILKLARQATHDQAVIIEGLIKQREQHEKQLVEANNLKVAIGKILERTTDHEYGTVAYADYRSAQIDCLREILSGNEIK